MKGVLPAEVRKQKGNGLPNLQFYESGDFFKNYLNSAFILGIFEIFENQGSGRGGSMFFFGQ